MSSTTKRALALAASIMGLAHAGCGAAVDHTATLARLRDAITAPISTTEQMEEHNRLVEDVVRSGALEGLRESDVQERLGRGEQCGVREICAEHGFRPNDWVYDVGRQAADPELPAGPTLVVGFDSSGRVDNSYYVTRR